MTEQDPLTAAADQVTRTDEAARHAARVRLEESGVDYGRLADLAGWLAGVAGQAPAQAPARIRLVSLGAAPPDRVADLAAAAEVTVVTLPTTTLPTTSVAAADAVQSGCRLVDTEVDGGCDLLLLTVTDPEADVAASALVGLLTKHDASAVTRSGATIDDEGWMRRCAEVRDTMRRGRPRLGEPLDLLDALGAPALATATGVLLQAAVRRTPVILDGPVTAAAALLAKRVAFRSTDWWLAAHLGPEPAHRLALERLGLAPAQDLRLREEDGSAPLLALALLRAAATLGA